jgi:hypothetical protein
MQGVRVPGRECLDGAGQVAAEVGARVPRHALIREERDAEAESALARANQARHAAHGRVHRDGEPAQ